MKTKIFDLIEFTYHVRLVGDTKARAIVLFDTESLQEYLYWIYDEYDWHYGRVHNDSSSKDITKIIVVSDTKKIQMIENTQFLKALKHIECGASGVEIKDVLKRGWEVVKKMNYKSMNYVDAYSLRTSQLAIFLRDNLLEFKKEEPHILLAYSFTYMNCFTKCEMNRIEINKKINIKVENSNGVDNEY